MYIKLSKKHSLLIKRGKLGLVRLGSQAHPSSPEPSQPQNQWLNSGFGEPLQIKPEDDKLKT